MKQHRKYLKTSVSANKYAVVNIYIQKIYRKNINYSNHRNRLLKEKLVKISSLIVKAIFESFLYVVYKIIRESICNSIKILEGQIITNMSSEQSELNRGNHSYLGLILTLGKY